MKCPPNCLTCIRDNFNREFLECRVCKLGYTLINGQCIVSCPINQGYSMVANTCSRCTDINCADCTGNSSICKKCNMMYSLSYGTCKLRCLQN
jgi:hypothetical protein